MGVKIVVGEGEALSNALRRFKKLFERNRPRVRWRRYQQYFNYYLKPCEIRRLNKSNAKIVARRTAAWLRDGLDIETLRSSYSVDYYD